MAEGDIGSVLDTLVCNSAASGAPSVAHVYGDIYVICWDEADTDGYMCTVDIGADGAIEDTVIELTHLESAVCMRPRIIKVAPNIFAYCYEYGLGHGIVRTIPIGNDGYITGGNIDLLEWETVDCAQPEICKVADNMFAVVYKDTNDYGKIVTFSIDDSGNISNTIIDSWVFHSAQVTYLRALIVDGNVFAFFYMDGMGDGWVATIAISAAGDITESIIDSLEFEPSGANRIKAAHFTGNVYASVHEDGLGHAWVCTMVIASGGAIDDDYADRLNFDSSYGHKPSVIAATSNVLAFAYEDSVTDGKIYTLWCLSDGDITQAPRDTMTFETSQAGEPQIFHVTGDIFAVAYIGPNSYITLKTFAISSLGIPKHLPLMGIG